MEEKISALITLIILFSGCFQSTQTNIESFVRTIPLFQQFLSAYPEADIVITYWSAEEIEQAASRLELACEKPMGATPMYRARAEYQGIEVVAWIDAVTYSILCTFQEGEISYPKELPPPEAPDVIRSSICETGQLLCNNECKAPACLADSECDDNDDGTIDSCLNSGTCSARCDNPFCTVSCHVNKDCGDSTANTVDTCVQPGTCDAHCMHETCEIVCTNDEDCDDSVIDTTDTCLDPGTCSSSCSHETCEITCHNNIDCDDRDITTTNLCINRATCDSYCEINIPDS